MSVYELQYDEYHSIINVHKEYINTRVNIITTNYYHKIFIDWKDYIENYYK